MIELGLVAGYLIAWAWRKARRVGAGVDREVDQVLDVGLDRLHGLVSAKLGPDPALEKLQAEAMATGEASERTQRRVKDAIVEAAEEDSEFAAALEAILAELAQSAQAAGVISYGERSAAVGGDAEIRADHGAVAGLTIGDVNLGALPPDPKEPGRSGG